MATHRVPQEHAGSRRFLVYGGVPVVVVALAVAAFTLFVGDTAASLERDSDLCPVADSQIAERAVLLLDLRKPLGVQGRRHLGESLDRVASELAANGELRVFALSGASAAPRQSIDRLCKPFDQGALAGTPAGRSGCDALPAELAERDAAVRFCSRHGILQGMVEGMAAQRIAAPVANAYLVEAIEETSLEFAQAAGPKSFYLFSDMIQHARWYSQAERGPAGLSFSEFDRLRSAQDATVGPRPAPLRDIDVTIFYVPRSGVTEGAEGRGLHKRFWQEYMADAFGAAPVFHELPATAAYAVTPLFGQPTDSEAAVLERERLAQERQEAERLLAEVGRERAALEEARRTALRQAEAAREAQQQRERELAEAAAAEDVSAAATEDIKAAAVDTPAATTPPPLQVAGTAPEAVQSPGSIDLAAEPEQSADATSLDAPVEGALPPDPAAPELPLADLDIAAAGTSNPACPPRLKRRFVGVEPEFPRSPRARYANATMVVRFLVDEEGRTVDSAVEVVRDESAARPEVFFDQFADSARDLVTRWEFDFEEDEACTRRQQMTTQFEFAYR